MQQNNVRFLLGTATYVFPNTVTCYGGRGGEGGGEGGGLEGICSCICASKVFHVYWQGRIELPKAARGHATYIDGKILSVTKYSFQIYFRLYTCNDASAIAYRWIG